MNKEAYLEYLKERKSSHKKNYYLLSLEELERIKKGYPIKPKLLLHACCAPCASWPLEFLSDHFEITLYYANSNIYPKEEYQKRRDELERFVQEVWNNKVSIVFPPYDNIAYTEKLAPYKDDPEGWERCFLCYRMRLEDTFAYAKENHYDFVSTVMTISRQKDSQKINEIGLDVQKKYPMIQYFVSDFKKNNGQVRRDELVKEYNLYHQDYCGCVYSYNERQKKLED
ncbi:MAG: epoxyqueuosine reductase QueH [Solobacterium sp.]|nr:epoxyqueuosine reductase QueH [Solobacterium sp.]